MANNLSSAFSGCSGLDAILDGLEGRGPPKHADKPAAIKRKRKLLVAKARPAPKPKLLPKSAPAMPAAEPGAVPAAAPAAKAAAAPVAAQADALSDTRKCVHSRAYKAAAKAAKKAGLNVAQISAAACKAGRAAAEQWDLDHP